MHHNSTFVAYDTTLADLASGADGGGLFMGGSCQGCSALLVNSRFVRNAAGGSGGAMWIGNGTVILHDALLVDNKAEETGGALFVDNGARVSATGCKVQGCRAMHGGGLITTGKSQVKLAKCTFQNCTSDLVGGALAASDKARLQMRSCVLDSNSAGNGGGAIGMDGSALLLADNCVFKHNRCLFVLSSRGGGIHCQQNASVQLTSCFISGNTAEDGGGIYVGRNAALSSRRTKVEGNKASNRGGGVVLGSENFNVVQVRAAVQSNQAGNVAPDVFVVPTKMFTTNSRTVERFVSRLNSDEGLVDITLRVMGAQDLPSEGIPIAAHIDDVVLATAKSGLDGLAHLLVKLRKPPGTSRWAARGLVILRYANSTSMSVSAASVGMAVKPA